MASSAYVVQPYGTKPYAKGKGDLTAIIETLIDKSISNIKSGQYPNKKSFLVINLSIIPPMLTDNRNLKPAYCDKYMFEKAVSGELWMMVFGQPGTPILVIPEFWGRPCVESIMEKTGILMDPQYDSKLAGILFMIHPLSSNAKIFGLYKYEKHSLWADSAPEVVGILEKLTGQDWNDEMDTNGFRLQGDAHTAKGD